MKDIKLSLALAAAVLLASAPVTLLTADPTWLPNAALLVVLISGSSALLRRLGSLLSQVVTFLGWMAFLGLVWQPKSQPDDGIIERLQTLVLSGCEHIQTSTTPIPPHPGTLWLLLAFLGIVLITAELLTITLRQPAWSIAALATPFLRLAIALPEQVPWWHAGLLVAGYCLVLATESANKAAAPKNVMTDTGDAPTGSGRFRLAALVAAPVALAAFVVGTVLPTGQFDRLLSGRSPQTLELGDPSLDLADNLRSPTNRVVLTYRTNAANGAHLRLTVLPIIDGNGARLGDAQVRSGAIDSPQLPGIATAITTEVAIDGFASEYLPAPYAPTRIEAAGEWGWEPLSRSVLSLDTNRKSATQGLRYTVDSVVPTPDAAQLAAASAGLAPDGDERTGLVPDNIPTSIVALTKHITQESTTDGQRAIAIQNFLRDPANFTYNIQAPEGAGFEVLERFLLTERSGYCVHFATAMALMARIEHIPSRVAIGFLPGNRGTDDRWTVTAHDMHAWPELYFAELGWVAFEPTAAVAGTPEWTAPQPSASPPAPPTNAEPTAPPTSQPTTLATPSESPESPTPVMPRATPSIWPAVIGWLLGVLAVLLTPWAIRTLLRRHRLAAGQAPAERISNAWAETRAMWIDQGGTWPKGSPRRVAAVVGADLDAESAATLTQIALLLERSLYSQHLTDPGELADPVNALRQGMYRREKPLHKVRRLLLPRSLWAGSIRRWRSLS